jgi:hypothetical protein
MRAVRTAAVLAAVTGSALAGAGTAAPAAAASTQTLFNGHVSVSVVSGPLPVGAGISVVQHCPKGHDLDRRQTRAAGEFHDERLAVRSTEYWPAGRVVRYRVVERIGADDATGLMTAAVCRSRVAAKAKTLKVKAKTELRVWGPAPAKVLLLNATVGLVTDDPTLGSAFRTSMAAAGIDEHPRALQGALETLQEEMTEDDPGAVVAVGTTRRKVARGQFVSLGNAYRMTADLTQRADW